MKKSLQRFLREEDAPTMVEYGLLVALIALVVAVGAFFLGNQISSLFNRAGQTLQDSPATTGG